MLPHDVEAMTILLDIRAMRWAMRRDRSIGSSARARQGNDCAARASLQHPCVPVAGRRRGDDRGVCPSDEMAYRIASECLVHVRGVSCDAAMRCRSSSVTTSNITRVRSMAVWPVRAQLDKALDRGGDSRAISTHCSDYAGIFATGEALIVLAHDDHALDDTHMRAIRRITQTHPMVMINVGTINPFSSDPIPRGRMHPCRWRDGPEDSRVPAQHVSGAVSWTP